jgi:two-component system chemotaxis response regulator CheB
MSGGEHRGGSAPAFDVVVIAASLGGPAAVGHVLAALPADYPAPVLVVQHRSPANDHPYVAALTRRAALPVRAAVDGEPLPTSGVTILPGRQTGSIDTTGELRLRPQADFRVADPLIVSVAEHYHGRALCVVLTGRLDDAAAGVRALKRRGGRAIAQDPVTAQASDMPLAALATGCVDLVLPLACLPHALIALTMAPGAADLFRVPPPPWANLAA